MDLFVAWNAKLLETFFPPNPRGDEVWLAVGSDELDDIAPELGGYAGLLKAVREGPSWPTLWNGYRYYSHGTVDDLTERGLGLRRQRRGPRPHGYISPEETIPYLKGTRPPSYLPILAVLVSSSAERGADGYYPHLQAALRMSQPWGGQQLERLNELFNDLQTWSNEQRGAFGRFVVRQIGFHRHVGVPRSQCIVLRRDAERLPRVFAQAGVRPGQCVDESLLDQVITLCADSPDLSAGFRDAVGHTEFHPLLRELLAAHIDDWDGVVEPKSTMEPGMGVTRELRVALALDDHGALPWVVCWRMQGAWDSGRMVLCDPKTGGRWQTLLSGQCEVTLTPWADADGSVVLGQLAADASAVEFEIRHDWDGPCAGACALLYRPLRYLVRDPGTNVLVEHGFLPAHGMAYLLCAPANLAALQTVTAASDVPLVSCPTAGLPPGWTLWLIADCSSLDDVQRILPDGMGAQARPRMLRLVGGNRVRRGGRIVFLPYDLPLLELDAPPGTSVDADGLNLVPVAAQARSTPVLTAPSLRRFRIEVLDPRRSAFTITTTPCEGEPESLMLRLSVEGGLLVAGVRTGLDRFGKAVEGGPRLSGASLMDVQRASLALKNDLKLSSNDLGRALLESDLDELSARPEAHFLDALAQAPNGGLPYGQARDLLFRLLLNAGADASDVAGALRRLRRRGFIEIPADARGRWARVVASQPCIYLLPGELPGGRVAWGVGGTLRLAHWATLYEVGDARLCVDGHANELPSVRLVTGPAGMSPTIVERAGFAVVTCPARNIATWAASIGEVREQLASHGRETMGDQARFVGTMLYSPHIAGWRAAARPDAEPSWQVFRFDDPDTGKHLLHSIANRVEGVGWRYRFLWDERWGTWIARTSFAEWLRDRYNVPDAAPWPLSYHASSGTIWLPARLTVPHVVERALVLCSGAAPLELRLCREELDRSDGRIGGVDGSGRLIGAFNRVYDELLRTPPTATTWLGYPWVPRDVAEAVASRLSCRIDLC